MKPKPWIYIRKGEEGVTRTRKSDHKGRKREVYLLKFFSSFKTEDKNQKDITRL